MHYIDLEFGTYTIGHLPRYCTILMNLQLIQDYKKINLMHYSLWSQIIKSMLVPKKMYVSFVQINKPIDMVKHHYNCNFCIFTEIFTNLKFFSHQITCTYSENQVKSHQFFFFYFWTLSFLCKMWCQCACNIWLWWQEVPPWRKIFWRKTTRTVIFVL